MPEQHDFINGYISRLVKEVEELTKSKILSEAKNEFKDLEINELKKKLTDAEELSIKEKDDVAKTWQLALNEKDQEVSKMQSEMADSRRQLNAKNVELTTHATNVDNMQKQVEELKKQLREKDDLITKLKPEPKAIPIILEPEPKGRQKKNKGATLLID